MKFFHSSLPGHLDTTGRQCYHALLMLTTQKRALAIVAAACVLLTGCAPPGVRALHKGDRLVQAGKYDAAIEALTQATNLLGREEMEAQAKARNLLGLAYHGKGNAARARVCYEQALELNRNNAVVEADYNLGCLELEQTNLAAARDAFTTYTTWRAQDWNGFMKLGTVDYRLATKSANADSARRLNYEHARRDYDAANRIKQTAEAWNNVAMIDLAMMDLQRRPAPSRAALSNVVAEFKAALVCDTNYAPALLNLAVVYDPAGPCKFGDVQSAIDAYRRYLALTPPPPHAAEIGLMVTNMDKRERMMVQYPGQAPESPIIIGTPPTNKFNAIPRTNPPSRGPTPPPAAPPAPSAFNTTNPSSQRLDSTPPAPAVAASNTPDPSSRRLDAARPPPAPPPVASLSASNPPPVAVPPAPRLPGPSPPRPDIAGSASNGAASPSRGLATPVISNTAAAISNTASKTNIASASTPVQKPSLLARLFGRKPKPATPSVATNAGNPAFVTPLPASASFKTSDPSSQRLDATPVAPLVGPDSAARYAPPAVSTEPGNRAEAGRLVKEGAAAEKESRLKAAVASYEKAVKADPASYEASEALGMAAIKSEEYGVALEAFHHALALDPESPNARYSYAWALDKKEYYQDAANELEKLLARHPDETRAHLLLGNLYSQKLGQPDFARGHYRKVLEQDPGNAQAPGLRAWLQNNAEP